MYNIVSFMLHVCFLAVHDRLVVRSCLQILPLDCEVRHGQVCAARNDVLFVFWQAANDLIWQVQRIFDNLRRGEA